MRDFRSDREAQIKNAIREARGAPKPKGKHYGTSEDDLPMPPDNPEFDEFPEAFQNLVAGRFDAGVVARHAAEDQFFADADDARKHRVLAIRAREQLTHERARHAADVKRETLERNRRRVR